MAENVALTTTADASNIPASNPIFSNTSFWVGRQIPQRAWLLDKMRCNGATIVALESQADVRLIDDAKGFGPYLNGDYFSFRFIEDSIRKGIQQPLGRYRVSASSQTQAIQGKKGIMNKRTRTKFTEQDDRILYDTVIPIKNIDGPWRGTAIYKHLAQKYPRHTYQSWRSRFVDYLQYRHPHTNRAFIGNRNPEPEQVHEEVAADPPRSPKRRRLQASEETPNLHGPLNVNIQISPQAAAIVSEPAQQLQQSVPQSKVFSNAQLPDDQERTFDQENTTFVLTDNEVDTTDATLIHLRQSLLADPWLKSTILKRGFTLEQANNLYKAVPYICITAPERLDECWNEMATDYDIPPMHRTEEWKVFWSEVILPAYMKRNNLVDENDLQKHVAMVMKREKRQSTPEIKTEPIPNSLTPEDVQRERELSRARAEAELQLSSDNEDDGDDDGNDHDNRMFMGNNEKQLSSAATDPEEPCLFCPSLSPVLQRSVVTANNDSLGIIQENVTKDKAPKTTSDIRSSPKSPKKKLFGRTLHTEVLKSQNLAPHSIQDKIQSRVQIGEIRTASVVELEAADLLKNKKEVAEGTLSTPNPVQESTVLPQILSEESENSNTIGETKAAEILPHAVQQFMDVQDPPESGQRLPKSVPTSQLTAQSSNAPGVGNVITDTESNQTVSSTHNTNTSLAVIAGASHPHEEIETARINLVDEGIDDEDEVHSEKAASDTGSEFMAFDEEPERSQLWTAPSFDDTNTERDREEELKSDAQSLSDHNQAIGENPITVIQNPNLQANLDETNHEWRSHDSRIPVATRSKPTPRLHEAETQDLFQAAFEEDPSLLDVPSPEGGWEELGIDETEYDEFDTIIRTTETSVQFDDEDVFDPNELARKPSSYLSSESTTLSSIEHRRPRSTPQSPHRNAVIDISSDSSSDTESTISSVATHSTGNIASSNLAIGRDAGETESENEALSESEDSPPRHKSRIQDLQNWFSAQRTRYITLPNPIFHRLASAAAQAATLNLPTAALVLRIMTEKFTSSEIAHRWQCRERNRLFKPKQNLTDEEARNLVPDDMWGVWTIADDKALLSRNVTEVREVEVKHGEEGTRKRSRFLRARYAVPETGSSSVGKEVARQALLEGQTKPKPKVGLRDMVI